jgi:digeranylgeranylglycerophospholipid reductase
MERIRDVIVIGGGPSGLRAARRLADLGMDVLLLEKKTAIGERVTCTGIIGEKAFAEMGLDRSSVLSEIRTMTMVSPNFDSLDYEHPFPFACVVDRERFDRSLDEQARLAGAETVTSREVVDISVGPDSARVIAQDGENGRNVHFSRAVILATGISYRLNKKLGLGSPQGFLSGAQAELAVGSRVRPTVFIGRSVAPGAFAWLIPAGPGRIRIGLMTRQDSRENLERLIVRLYPDEAQALSKDSIQVKAIAQGAISRTFGDRVIAVGEAAGQVKTTTGGGVYFGLLCADIAAGILASGIRKGRVSAPDLAEYEREWKKSIHREILVGLSLRKLFARMSDATLEKLFQLAKNDGVIPQVRDQADFDRHSDLLLSMMKRTPFFQFLRPKLDSRPALRMN